MKEDVIDLTGCRMYDPDSFREVIREVRSLIVECIGNLGDAESVNIRKLGNVLYTLEYLCEEVKLVDNKYKKP